MWLGSLFLLGLGIFRCAVTKFSVDSGQVQNSFGGPPALSDDQLYLIHAAAAPDIRPVYGALANMEFYDPKPRRMKALPDSSGRSGILDSDGGNAPGVLSRPGFGCDDDQRGCFAVNSMRELAEQKHRGGRAKIGRGHNRRCRAGVVPRLLHSSKPQKRQSVLGA